MRRAAALGLAIGGGAVACDVPVETTATAHESFSFPDAPGPDGPVSEQLWLSTYHGGSGDEDITALAVTTGTYPHVIVVGGTSSSDFATTDGTAVDTTVTAGCSACPSDAFIAQLRGPGQGGWSTVIGGPGFERATAVALAGDGDVFVGGSAASLPATAITNAADATFAGGSTAERGGEDGFVCRLDGATGAKEWCTFVGGNGGGGVQALVADLSNGTVLVALTTAAAEALDGDADYNAAFAGRHRSSAGGADTVVVRLAGDGQSFVSATYAGGTGDEGGTPSLAVNAQGFFVLTTTSSSDAPVPGGVITTAPAGRNAYLASLSSDATTLRYGTYLGGAGDDWTPPNALSIGSSLVAGVNTTSADMPMGPGAQMAYGGGGSAGCGDGDGWLGVLHPGLTGAASLGSATYVGGSRGDEIAGITRIGSGQLIVAGRTYSSDFPLSTWFTPIRQALAGTPCPTNDNSDAFFIRYAESQTSLLLGERQLATYLGGAAMDGFTAAGASGNGAFYVVAGTTRSTEFPTAAAWQNGLRGSSDGVIATTAFWPTPTDPGDAGPDAAGGNTDASGADGGNVVDDGGGGCCGTTRGAPASSMLLALVALVVFRRRRAR